MLNNNINHIVGKSEQPTSKEQLISAPSYLNKTLKKVSRHELLTALREVNEKNKRLHWEMMRDTAQELHGGKFVCLPQIKI